MEDTNTIFNNVLSRMKDYDMWFSTKNDPTYKEPGSYYELDECGFPTEKTQKKICDEVMNYIGDGAVELPDAIELWINEQGAECRIAYTSNLVTKFKDKPVVDNINAYEVKLESKKQESITDSDFEIAKEKYNKIMGKIGREYLRVPNGENTENWNLRDMVAECDYNANTGSEMGLMGYEVAMLRRFISQYKDKIDDMVCTTNHYSLKYDNAPEHTPEETVTEAVNRFKHTNSSSESIYLEVLDKTFDSDIANKVVEQVLIERESKPVVENASDRYQLRKNGETAQPYGVYDTKADKFAMKGTKKVMSAATDDMNNKTKKQEAEFANEDLLNNFTQYVANNAKELDNGLYEIKIPKDLGYDKILTKDMLKKAYIKVKRLLNLSNGDTDIIFENKEIVKEGKLVKDIEKFGEKTKYTDKDGNVLNVGDLIYLPNKGYHLLRYSDNGGYYLYRPSLGFRQGPTTSKNGELIYKYNEIANKPLSNPYLEESKLTEDNIPLNDLNREQAKILDNELEDVLYILNKYSSNVDFKRAKTNIKISGDINFDSSLEADSEEAMQQKSDNFDKFVDDMKANGYKDFGGTKIFDMSYIPFNNAKGNAFVSLTKRINDVSVNVRFIMWTRGKTYNIDMKMKTNNMKTESVKARLQEENSKSAQVISDMFTSDDFDSQSASGQIVIRTSELFKALSAKGYDVQVTFDNGQSLSTILLSNQGAQINITITDSKQPLKCFASGNYEITDDVLKILSDVKESIKNL